MEHLSQGPKAFTLLGKPIVLWLTETGSPAVVEDRCCHRSAKLSLGQTQNGNLCCPYHGWQFNPQGACVRVPQLREGEAIPKTYQIPAYACQERYGYAWVCLRDPIREIPDIPEAKGTGYRLIPEFYEVWNCAGLRVMENELDLAHPTFVHTTTFGSEEHPIPETLEVHDTEWGIHAYGVLGVVNPERQQKNLKMNTAQTQRTLEMDWYLPFTVKLKITYPNGLEHIIVNTMTPIDDKKSQMVQFCLRNDRDVDTPCEEIIAFDRQVTLEDKRILESTDPDVPLLLGDEQHMLTDKPGIMIRKKIAALLNSYTG
jgi:phenylpropionate dioxygenase-like ring-hydroxylating dioxygenase large terminal subunit